MKRKRQATGMVYELAAEQGLMIDELLLHSMRGCGRATVAAERLKVPVEVFRKALRDNGWLTIGRGRNAVWVSPRGEQMREDEPEKEEEEERAKYRRDRLVHRAVLADMMTNRLYDVVIVIHADHGPLDGMTEAEMLERVREMGHSTIYYREGL